MPMRNVPPLGAASWMTFLTMMLVSAVQITAVANASGTAYGTISGTITGSDLEGGLIHTTAGAQDCINLCAATGGCLVAEFTDTTNACVLKTGTSGFDASSTSSILYRVGVALTIPGYMQGPSIESYSLWKSDSSIADIESCRSSCLNAATVDGKGNTVSCVMADFGDVGTAYQGCLKLAGIGGPPSKMAGSSIVVPGVKLVSALGEKALSASTFTVDLTSTELPQSQTTPHVSASPSGTLQSFTSTVVPDSFTSSSSESTQARRSSQSTDATTSTLAPTSVQISKTLLQPSESTTKTDVSTFSSQSTPAQTLNSCNSQDPSHLLNNANCVLVCFKSANADAYSTIAGSCEIMNESTSLLACLQTECNKDSGGIKVSQAQAVIDALAVNCCNTNNWDIAITDSSMTTSTSSSLVQSSQIRGASSLSYFASTATSGIPSFQSSLLAGSFSTIYSAFVTIGNSESTLNQKPGSSTSMPTTESSTLSSASTASAARQGLRLAAVVPVTATTSSTTSTTKTLTSTTSQTSR
ncbi:hypothetical protein BCR33DRAFT_743833 [Rhizoclosmatium globosum]|uniref:Apple domain-containing protein n=1 Tax=Rhizoclosmatium globosum TaxID=329046 RepID=A0A1Y2BGJ3_9FUNG|nr:hypothetical protein BCR33DRAFT_743833 [Rhizoclosmatium globosum]|eukprot:ORY33205.1 hypothetical protein BCR33DRAFT_743833 [Rhizoclosmatium globosum]